MLARDDYDLSRFIFTGLMPTAALAQLFAISDLHIYLTVPFVLSWSLMDALACGATVLASDTPPVREMIEHGQNGLLADFFDVEGLADAARSRAERPAGLQATRSGRSQHDPRAIQPGSLPAAKCWTFTNKPHTPRRSLECGDLSPLSPVAERPFFCPKL